MKNNNKYNLKKKNKSGFSIPNNPKKIIAKPLKAKKQNKSLDFIKENKWIILILALTATIYSIAVKNDFVNWDDNNYIHNNPFIKSLTLSNIKNIFTETYFANYHPLTTLSYAIEYALFKLNPHPYHLLNIILHLSNTLLVFLLIKSITKEKEVSLITALLFAIHPMHVESVAWISERKDVLYAMFFLSSLIFYLKYIKERVKIKFLIVSFVLCLCSLMSKSAAVSLPLIMLLLSYFINKKIILKDWLFSIPFFALSLVFGFIAIRTQKDAIGAINIYEIYTAFERILLICYSLYFYIIRFLAPYGFSAMHSYPLIENTTFQMIYYIAPAILILLIIIIFILKKEFRSILIFGILFFLSTIFLVIQLVPFGDAIVSERYTYIPYIGLSFILAKYIVIFKSKNNIKNIVIIAAVFYIAFLSISTLRQNSNWKNSEILWSKSIAANPDCYISYYSRGTARAELNDLKGAFDDFNKSISINPRYSIAYNNRGLTRVKLGDNNGAYEDYCKAIALDKNYANAYNNRGHLLAINGKLDEAYKDFNKAILIDTDYVEAYSNRGNVMALTNKYDEALIDYKKAIQLNPNYYNAYENIASLYFNKDEYIQALKYFEKVIEIVPQYAHGYYNRGSVKYKLNNFDGACEDWNTALKLGDKSAIEMTQMHCQK